MEMLYSSQLSFQVPRIITPGGAPSQLKNLEYPFQCLKCNISFQSEAELTAHNFPEMQALSHTVPVYKPPLSTVRLPCANEFNYCSLCSKYFSTNQGYKQHLGKVHETNGKNSECHLCHKLFKHKHALKFHMDQVHDQRKRVACHRCNREFYNKYKLKNHLRKCQVIDDKGTEVKC